MENKHAYLIIAHNQPELLKILLKSLDYSDNDIYVHLDKKMGNISLDPYYEAVKYSGLYFLSNRLDVRWGDFSQIECELRLLEASIPQKYQYYHLMSGVDLPLKSQEEIHSFFNRHAGTEYVHFDAEQIDPLSYKRVSKYIFIQKRNKNLFEKIIYKIMMILQFGVDRGKKTKLIYQKGANWFSITHALAEYVVSNRSLIEKQFKYTLCADEVFLQTLVANSNFMNFVSENNFSDNYETIQYCIDWNRGNPYEFRLNDFNYLINSKMLYARKFNWNVDSEIVLKIYENIKNQIPNKKS